MNNGSNDKKLRIKSLQMRSQERSDYKLEPARALDVFAGIVSIVAAILVWLYI